MIDNPFSNLDARLERIERLILEFKREQMQAAVHNTRDIIDVHEASKLTGFAVQTLYGKVSKREIPHIKKGGKLRFSQQELVSWMEESKRPTLNSQVESAIVSMVSKKRSRGIKL